ncbi:DUF2142 domain-containing protein [Streptococcus acidominimus]|uniref:DUF2142 domain-containing protein n=1 Tax=Streptococcus acidominimus TaxID=1326 RepID=UPI001431CB6A|nr:DUF2142 domain-containing protein [Streptococcus acidominimus]
MVKQNLKYSLALLVVAVLVLIAYPGEVGIPKFIYLITGLFFLVSLFLPHLLDKWNGKGVYLLIAFLGIISALVTPILNTPDEPVHFARALKVATGEVNLDNLPEHLTVSQDYQEVNRQAKVPITKTDLFFIPTSDRQTKFVHQADYRATNQYSFLSYLPQAFGILIGKLLRVNVGYIFYLGRIFNALVYAMFAVFAIKLSGSFKQLMFAGVSLPMSISLAGSYNQDASSIGIQLLAIGFLLHLLEKEEKISLFDVLSYALICGVIVLTKLPFVVFAGLLIFIPKKRFSSKVVYLSTFLIGILLVIATGIWYKVSGEVYYPFNLPGTDLSSQLHHLSSQPSVYIPVLLKEFVNIGSRASQLFIFGWLDLPMSNLYPYFLLLYTTIVGLNMGKYTLPKWIKIGLLLVSSVIILGVVTVMYLTWTPVAAMEVSGVQGRYYISIYVIIMLLIASFKPKAFTVNQVSDSLVLQTSLYSNVAMLLLSISMLP